MIGGLSSVMTQILKSARGISRDRVSAPVLEFKTDNDTEDDDEGNVNLRAMLYQRFLVKCQKLQVKSTHFDPTLLVP